MQAAAKIETDQAREIEVPRERGAGWSLAARVRVGGQWHEVTTRPDAQAQPVWTTPTAADGAKHPHACEGRWTSRGGHVLTLEAPAPGPIERIEVQLATPLRNYAKVIIPDCGRHYVNSTKALDARAALYRVTAPNAGHPFMVLLDEGGAVDIAFGLLDARGEVEIRRVLPVISQRKAMVGGDEHLVVVMAYTPGEADAAALCTSVYLRTEAATWFDALRDYTGRIAQREEIAQPHNPAAWEPVWCTWTAFPSAEMNPARVLENARYARELGAGAIILDDGWFGPGLDDDGPRDINHGDYHPDPHKFDDLGALVRDIQALDLKFLLWHAPLCVAPNAQMHKSRHHQLMKRGGQIYLSVNGLAQLCPACPDVRAFVADETVRLLRTFGADGLKVDLYNCLPDTRCESTDHEHDISDPVEAVDAVMAAIWKAARDYDPNVLVELKQDYGNVRLARHGTMVRAGDTAYDIDTNTQRCAYTQAFARCVHVDPLVTSIHTTPEAMALMMIKAVALGVPTLSIDLARIGPELRGIIRHYLGVYRRLLPLLMQPRRPQSSDTNVWEGADGSGDAWLAALAAARVIRIPDADRITLLNGTAREQLFVEDAPRRGLWAVTRYDYAGRELGTTRENIAAGAAIAVPAAGMAQLVYQGH